MPPVSKIWRTMSSAMSKPWYLKIDSTTPSFSVEKGCALPISRSGTMKNVLSGGSAMPAFSAIAGAGRAMVSAVRRPSASQ